MKVKDLIQRLQKFDPELECLLASNIDRHDYKMYPIEMIRLVRLGETEENFSGPCYTKNPEKVLLYIFP